MAARSSNVFKHGLVVRRPMTTYNSDASMNDAIETQFQSRFPQKRPPMKCPIDSNELVQTKYEADINVDQCGSCGGIWLDQKELERIQESSERDYTSEIAALPNLVEQAYAAALAKQKPLLNCPSCDKQMERREHGGCSQIMIDTCPSCCGVWLDDGEIKALEVFFERTASETEEVREGFFASLSQFFLK